MRGNGTANREDERYGCPEQVNRREQKQSSRESPDKDDAGCADAHRRTGTSDEAARERVGSPERCGREEHTGGGIYDEHWSRKSIAQTIARLWTSLGDSEK